jgi:hypothetical protein
MNDGFEPGVLRVTGNATVTLTGGTTAREKPAPCEDGKHCWHYAAFQHAMMHHRDETCCHCGKDRCVSTYDEYMKAREGHGQFHP